MTARARRSALAAVLAGIAVGGVTLGGIAWIGQGEAPLERVPNGANDRVRVVESEPGGAWTVQLLSDIQDGFPYVPRLLREGVEHGARAVVISGDLATGAGGQHLPLLLREFREHPSQLPVFAVPGDHDAIGPPERRIFNAAFGASDFEFRIGSTWFLGFDSTDPGARAATIERVRSRVAAAAAAGEHVIVVAHHSPLQITREGEDGDPRRIDHELLATLLQPSVAFVISGHVHRERSDLLSGVRFLIAPPSGDKSNGQGQTAVNYLLLRWDGTRYTLERHRFTRRNDLEVQAVMNDDFFAHLQPWLHALLHGRPRTGAVIAEAGGAAPAAPERAR